jgi:hypothetical protein
MRDEAEIHRLVYTINNVCAEHQLMGPCPDLCALMSIFSPKFMNFILL